jgi:hypothetical protein
MCHHNDARSVGPAGVIRVAVLVGTALLLTACNGTVECGPCPPPVVVTIIGVVPDPARVLRVCVDGEGSCDELSIGPAVDSSTSPADETRYACTVSDPYTRCYLLGDWANVSFDRLGPKDLDGRHVVVTATGGQSADEYATGVFQFQPEHATCECDSSSAVVHLSATS